MSYTTVRGEAESEFIENKSRFIGQVRPVPDEAEAMRFVEKVRAKYPDASHNVWAYNLRQGRCRCSDDGEPSGTAGQPALDALQKAGVEDAVVVVTRYFGGILLGAGGLVRAYSRAARDAVNEAGVCEASLCYELRFSVDYGLYGKVERLLPAHHAELLDTSFASDVTLTVRLRAERREALTAALVELTAGRCKVETTGECWLDLP